VSGQGEIARAIRAAQRDNARDCVTAALELECGLSRESAHWAAGIAVEALAGWLRQRSSSVLAGDPFVLASEWAARLVEEFTP